MLIPDYKNTLKLTHYGRKSNEPFDVTIWFTNIDDELWIGSLDENRNWVKNVKANSKALVDFGDGAQAMTAEYRGDAEAGERYRLAVQAKYPILSRLIAFFGRGKTRAQFRLKPTVRLGSSGRLDDPFAS